MNEVAVTLERCEAAARVLRAAGLSGAGVAAAGPEAEIAVVRVAVTEWSRLLHPDAAALVAALKAEGFRHVALDLDVDPPGE
ncbi:MAG: hypothetical protein KY464_09475 [Gemmatimonadetes bacterium]|nr:hypothetical protein [Gemmatimonadota bacterium]